MNRIQEIKGRRDEIRERLESIRDEDVSECVIDKFAKHAPSDIRFLFGEVERLENIIKTYEDAAVTIYNAQKITATKEGIPHVFKRSELNA